MMKTMRVILLGAVFVLAAVSMACEDILESPEEQSPGDTPSGTDGGQIWSYTVTWDLNGGDGEVPPPQIVKNPARTTGALPPAPMRAGYSFIGWYTGGGVAFTQTTIVNSDITVYAHWGKEDPQLHYRFNNGVDGLIADESGNGFNLTLKDGASIKTLGEYHFLNTGNTGWADMGAGTGELTSRLNNFTIAFYVYIPGSTNITADGNMIFSFSNSDDLASSANGAMYIQAKNDRQGFTIGPQHWTGEQYVRGVDYFGTNSGKGLWHHVAYTQAGKTGTNNGNLYIDGTRKAQGTITMTPADLGKTAYNFFAKPPYSADAFLVNTLIWDFRVYDYVLDAAVIDGLAGELSGLGTALYTEQLEEYIGIFEDESLPLLNLSSVTRNLSLPATGGDGISITWTSSNTACLTNNGTVTRPAGNNQTFDLTAVFSKGTVTVDKIYPVTVIQEYDDAEKVAADKAALELTGNIENLHSNLILPASGIEGCTISWASGNTAYLTNEGVVTLAPHGSGPVQVTLTATISSGGVSDTKQFMVNIAEDEGYGGYLFVYFTGNNAAQEQLRYATSTDGLKYTALNSNNPIISSGSISRSGGIRDPHILRGEDGKFYMVMTDMQSGLGWNSNRGIILLKSDDLITWTHSQVHFPEKYAAGTAFADVTRVWAPQTIYDEAAGKYLIYFSLYGGSINANTIYYAYANAGFTDLEGPPQILVDPGLSQRNSMIDGDIIFYKNKYHLFYKEESGMNDISKMVSSNLTSGYQPTNMIFNDDPNGSSRDAEGSCVFRLYNTDTWVLMYDVYNQSKYEFRRSTDLENFTTVNANDVSATFGPRHGTVIPITLNEMNALIAKVW